MALLEPSCAPLGPSVQVHPQNTPSILGTIRYGRGVRIADRSHDTRIRISDDATAILCGYRRPTHPHDVLVDRLQALPSNRRAFWLRLAIQFTQVLSILGRRRFPRSTSREVHRQLRQLFQVVGLDLRYGAES